MAQPAAIARAVDQQRMSILATLMTTGSFVDTLQAVVNY